MSDNWLVGVLLFSRMRTVTPIVKIHFANVASDDTDELINSKADRLPAHAFAIANRFARKIDSRLHLMGRVLLLASMDEWGIRMPLDKMSFTSYKKPYFDGPFKFNISHSGSWVACASSINNELGIDMEVIEEIDIEDFASAFTSNEWADVQSSPNKLVAFYERWTMKEAISKANGKGQYLNLKSINTSGNSLYENWFVNLVSLDKSVVCHLASQGRVEHMQVVKLNAGSITFLPPQSTPEMFQHH